MPCFRALHALAAILLLAPPAWGGPLAQTAGVTAEVSVPIQLDQATTAIATLRVPTGLGPGQKVPALLVFGGFESAAQVLSLVHPNAPIVLGSFDYPFTAPRRLSFPESLRSLPEAKRLYPRTVTGILALTRALQSRPEIDTARIYLAGASFGSPFALAAAASPSGRESIAGIALVHGFGRAPETAEHVILRSWLPRFGWVARPGAWLLARGLWLYLDVNAPEDLAAGLAQKQSVLFVSAERDSFVPPESSEALWRAIQSSPAGPRAVRLSMPTDHLMPGSEPIIRQITDQVQQWIAKDR